VLLRITPTITRIFEEFLVREVEAEEMLRVKEVFEQNGVARIGGLFDKSEIDALRAKAFLNFRKSADHQIQWRGDFPALMFWPTLLDEYSRALAPIVKQFLGPDVMQLNKQYYFRMPGDGDEFAWHQDICFRVPKEKFPRVEEGYLQTAIIVDKMDAENGGIRYVTGSHKMGELALVPRDGSEKGLRHYNGDQFEGPCASCNPGDLLLWSAMVVHGSEKNDSHRPRGYFMNGFAKRECVDASVTEFPAYMKGGKLCNP
jgi:hypothetical protein